MVNDISIWQNDKLNRQKEAEFLKKYLNEIYQESTADLNLESFVLNLNADWGYGKTFFLTKLKEHLHEIDKHPVMYFDAWQNDYSKNPLLGFISEIQNNLKDYEKQIPISGELLENFKEKSRKLISAISGIGANILVKKITGDTLDDLKTKYDSGMDSNEIAKIFGDNSEKLINGLVQKSLDEHQETKVLIVDFKNSLERITKSLHDDANYNLPMYILIDELDRCRPTFAIELLENIKHLFNIKGVYFIVATNKMQLANSIKTVYGDSFDSIAYLRRFFDQEYELAEPKYSEFIDFIFTKHKINSDKLFSPFESKLNNTTNFENFFFEKVSLAFKLSLRDIEQIAVQLKSIIVTNKNIKLHYPYLLFLIVLMRNQYEPLHQLIRKLNDGILEKYTDFNIKARETHNSFNSGVSELNARSIIHFYNNLSYKSKIEISRQLNGISNYQQTVITTLNMEPGSSDSKTSISYYESLIRQAGHITQ